MFSETYGPFSSIQRGVLHCGGGGKHTPAYFWDCRKHPEAGTTTVLDKGSFVKRTVTEGEQQVFPMPLVPALMSFLSTCPGGPWQEPHLTRHDSCKATGR